MGITDINNTIKKICPEAFCEFPLNKFKGYAIGVDSSLWLFKAKSAAMKDAIQSSSDILQPLDQQQMIDNILKQFYGFVFKIANAGITPVWIMDGKTHCAKIACEKRKQERDAKKVDIEAERERIQQLSLLERQSEIPGFTKKLLTQVIPTWKERQALEEEVRSLGLPCLQAPNDAEIFASALSRRQLLLGVWTTDTDTYACGSLITISGFAKGYYTEGAKVNIFVTSIVLDTLGITQQQFRDLCILHQCDFNNRIPKLGPATILKKMEQYNWDLDRFIESEPEKEWSLVNLEECRQIFDGPDVSQYTLEDLKIDRVKWVEKLSTKTFDIDYPPEPKLVELN